MENRSSDWNLIDILGFMVAMSFITWLAALMFEELFGISILYVLYAMIKEVRSMALLILFLIWSIISAANISCYVWCWVSIFGDLIEDEDEIVYHFGPERRRVISFLKQKYGSIKTYFILISICPLVHLKTFCLTISTLSSAVKMKFRDYKNGNN